MCMLYIKKMFIFINLQLFDVCSQKRKCQRNYNSQWKWKKNTIFELGFHVFLSSYIFFYFQTNSFTLYFQCFQEQYDCFILFVFFSFLQIFSPYAEYIKKMRQKWNSGTKTIRIKMKHERYISVARCDRECETHQQLQCEREILDSKTN